MSANWQYGNVQEQRKHSKYSLEDKLNTDK